MTRTPDQVLRASSLQRLANRKAARGFTLIEISVALIAGLIVSLAVVAMSRDATNTFHEEARSAAAESALRVAIDRLRNDLSRAGFMSSPNLAPPVVAGVNDTGRDPTVVSAYTPPTSGQIRKIAGIRLYNKGSEKIANVVGAEVAPTIKGTDEGSVTLSNQNGVHPDMIDITGNFTTADSYTVQTIQTGSAVGGTCTSGDRLVLAGYTAASYRVTGVASAAGLAAMEAAFRPGNANGIIRIVDDTGRTQYAVACNTGITVGTPANPYVDINGSVVMGSADGVGGLKGFASGRAMINPVTTVRWRIAPRTEYTAYAKLDDTSDSTRFDLYRSFVSAAGTESAADAELIAEYAVDLKFAFTSDEANVMPFGSGPTVTSYAFDTTSSSALAATQRVRSVRARLATRAALPDRTKDLPTPVGAPYLYRYCTEPPASGPCTKLARVRTIITEVALQNQARVFW